MASKKELLDKIRLSKEVAKLAKDGEGRLSKEADLAKLKMEYIKEHVKDAKKAAKLLSDQEKTLKEIAKLEEQIAESKSEAEAATAGIEAATKSLLKRTLLVNDAWKTGIVGSIMASKKPLEDLGKALEENLTVTNLMGTAIQNMAEATLDLLVNSDAASAAINKFTAQGKSYRGMVKGMHMGNMHLGVSMESVTESYNALYGGFTKFSSLSKKNKRELTLHAAKLDVVGVSASTSAANFETLSTTFGMSTAAAIETQRGMVDTARAMGLPPQQMMEGFQNAMPVLSKWGKAAPRIFKKVMIQSKKLGVEMGTLLNLGDQFDTFEGAASAVGKLNAMVGGDVLNAYDMMNMSLDERNMAVKRAVELDGESWGSMNRMKQMAYANAAGITDMEQAHRLFGGASADSMTLEEKRIDSQVKSQKSLERALTRTVTILDRIANVIKRIFDSPAMEYLLSLAESSLLFVEKHSGKISMALPYLLGAGAIYKAGGFGMMASAAGGLKTMMGGAAQIGPTTASGSFVSKGLGMKGAAKFAGRAVPGIGALVSGYDAYGKAQEGDVTGAAISGLSTGLYAAAATAGLTGIGAPVAAGLGLAGLAVSGAGMLRDAYKTSQPKAASTTTNSAGSPSAKSEAESSLVRAFTTAINNAQGHDVILKIDGNEIGRFTESYIGKKYKIK